jgi:hypothetical protein
LRVFLKTLIGMIARHPPPSLWNLRIVEPCVSVAMSSPSQCLLSGYWRRTRLVIIHRRYVAIPNSRPSTDWLSPEIHSFGNITS